MRRELFTKIWSACQALKAGRIVTISGKRGLQVAVLAEFATKESVAALVVQAPGILCLTLPMATQLPPISSAVRDRFEVGRLAIGNISASAEEEQKEHQILIPIRGRRNGVLSAPGPVECAMDLARLAGTSPCVIIGSAAAAPRLDDGEPSGFTPVEFVSVEEMVECRLAMQQDGWSKPCQHMAVAGSCACIRMQNFFNHGAIARKA